MEIVSSSEFQKRVHGGCKPILRLRKKGQITLSATAVYGDGSNVALEKDGKGREIVYVQFGFDNGQLFLRLSKINLQDSFKFVKNNSDLFTLSNKALSLHLMKYTNSDAESVPCMVNVEAVKDGWMPVITTYWKTIQ